MKGPWELGHSQFEGLLRKLSPNRDTAAAEYEGLRVRLTRFFQWRGCQEPEIFADRTLDRLARRLEGGEQVDSVYSYCCGIGRMLLLEERRSSEKNSQAIDQWATTQLTPGENEQVPMEALMQCLGRFPVQTQQLVLDYYHGSQRDLIEQRKAIASRLGISMNTLRLRMSRIRVQLENCVKDSLRKGRTQ